MAKDRSMARRSDSRISPRSAPLQGEDGPAASPEYWSSTSERAPDAQEQDSLTVEEVGVHWVRARWSITSKTLERADSAMGRESHRSSRVLRVSRVEQDDSGPRSKELMQEIPLPPQVNEWFLHLPPTEHAWMMEVGLVFGQGRFFSMLHSVPMVLNGTRAPLTGAQKFLGSERFLDSLDSGEPPPLKVQGKFVMNGVTRPGSQAFIDDQPVSVCPHTGEFEWELPLANGRIVIPMNVLDCGKVQRALMAIDLNFHLLEPESDPEH